MVKLVFERIRNLREDKDLTQEYLARRLHCCQNMYSRYERGLAIIPPQVLITLAEFHQTSIDYLLEITDYPKSYPKSQK